MLKLFIVRRGSCKRCGRCCDKSLSQPKYWHHDMKPTDDPDVRIAIEKATGKPFMVRRVCVSLEHGEDGKAGCAIYDKRKEICRDFPRGPWDIKLLPGCGYYFTLEWREDG